MLGSETFVEPYMGANDDLYERMVINYKEEHKYDKLFTRKCCTIYSCIIGVIIVGGFLFLDYKCDVFSDSVTLCDLPNYCPIKNECHGSNIE